MSLNTLSSQKQGGNTLTYHRCRSSLSQRQWPGTLQQAGVVAASTPVFRGDA